MLMLTMQSLRRQVTSNSWKKFAILAGKGNVKNHRNDSECCELSGTVLTKHKNHLWSPPCDCYLTGGNKEYRYIPMHGYNSVSRGDNIHFICGDYIFRDTVLDEELRTVAKLRAEFLWEPYQLPRGHSWIWSTIR